MAAVVLDTITSLIKTGAQLTQLSTVGGLYAGLNFNVLLAGHCIAMARYFKGSHGSAFLLNYVMGFLMAFGGGIASAMFLGLPNPLLASNTLTTFWTAAWWVVNFCPGDPIGKAYEVSIIVPALADACLQLLRAGMIIERVNAAASMYPGVIAAAIVAGVLGGAGGKIVTDVLASSIGLRAPWEIATPTYALRSSLTATALYYITVVYLKALTAVEGAALVTTLFVGASIARNVLSYELGYTEVFVDVLYTVTLMPTGKAGRARGRPASKARATSEDAPASGKKATRTPRGRSKSRGG